MGLVKTPQESLLVVACFSRHPEALDWAVEQLSAPLGPIALQSPDFDFHHTRYYEASMGTGLRKRFLAFARPVPPDCLSEMKLWTNDLEERLAHTGRYPEARPLNLDPGLLQLGKFMLATTKDQAHRIYLRDGIFAEVTLFFRQGEFEPWPWTYADYREAHVRAWLKEAREYLKRVMQTPMPE